MQIEKKKADAEASYRVSKLADFISIYLESCIFRRSSDALKYESVQAHISHEEVLINELDNVFDSGISICLKVTPKDDDRKEVVYIEAKYILSYQLKSNEGISAEDILAFCRMNGLFNAWPFWRELVSNMAYRGDLPIPTMPLMKFVPPATSKTKKTVSHK
jgi:hypothetical protein